MALTHPDYSLSYQGPLSGIVGESVALIWSLTRADGLGVAAPSSKTVVVYDETGVAVATLTADQQVDGPNPMQVLAALWPIGAQGDFEAEISVTITDSGDTQTRIDRVPITVT